MHYNYHDFFYHRALVFFNITFLCRCQPCPQQECFLLIYICSKYSCRLCRTNHFCLTSVLSVSRHLLLSLHTLTLVCRKPKPPRIDVPITAQRGPLHHRHTCLGEMSQLRHKSSVFILHVQRNGPHEVSSVGFACPPPRPPQVQRTNTFIC